MAGVAAGDQTSASRRRVIHEEVNGSMRKGVSPDETAAGRLDLGEFSPFENDLLVQSELLIENQRERILRLKSKLGEAEAVRVHELGKCHAESRELKEANAKLRLEIDLLQGELVAQADNDDSGLLVGGEWRLKLKEKEAEVARLKSELSKLSEQSQAFNRMQLENEQLRQTIDSRNKGVLKEELQAEERLLILRRQIGEAEGMLRHLILKRDETRVAATAMVDSEFELMETRQTVQDQKTHILKLQKALDAAIRERTMIPPTVMVMKQDQPSREDKADALDKWLNENVQKITEMFSKNAPTLKEPGGTGGASAVDPASIQSDLLMKLTLSVNSLAERQDLHLRTAQRQIAKAGGEFVCLDVKHTRLLVDGNLIPRGGSELIDFAQESLMKAEGKAEGHFYDRLLGVHDKLLLIYEADAPDHPIYRLEEHKTAASWDPTYQVIVLRYERGPKPSDVECHVFQMDKADDFARLFHALQYSQIVPEHGSAGAVPDSVPLVNSCALVYATQDTPRGSKHNFAVNELVVIFDQETNKVYFTNRKDPKDIKAVIDASSTILQADPTSMCLKLWCYPNPTDESRRSLLGIVFFKPEDQYNDQLLKALLLKWKGTHIGNGTYRAPMDLSGLADLSQSYSESDSSSTDSDKKKTKGKNDFFDSFVVADRSIKLYEKPGGAPLLTLRAEDCVVTCDDKSRRVLVTRLGADGHADDQFMFEFEDDERYAKKKADLKANGFFDRKVPSNMKFDNEVAVVEKGVLKLYKHYGDADDQPFLTSMAASSAASFDAERREIHLTEKFAGGKGRKMKLDCSSTREYENWKRALLFAGFIKEDIGANAETTAAFSNLAQYLFPIKMDTDLPKDRQYIRVQDDKILFFADPANAQPLYTVNGTEVEVTRDTASRTVRIRRWSGEPVGERIEVVMPSIQSYDTLIDDLTKAHLLGGEKRSIVLNQGGVVRFRRKGIQCWKSVKDYATQKEALYVIPSDLYFGGMDNRGLHVKSRPFEQLSPANQELLKRLGTKTGFTKALKHNRDRAKWNFGLYVADMQGPTRQKPDELFKPIITHSFVVHKPLAPVSGGSLGSVFQSRAASQRQLSLLKGVMDQDKGTDNQNLRLSRAITSAELAEARKSAPVVHSQQSQSDLGGLNMSEHTPTLGLVKKGSDTNLLSDLEHNHSSELHLSTITPPDVQNLQSRPVDGGQRTHTHTNLQQQPLDISRTDARQDNRVDIGRDDGSHTQSVVTTSATGSEKHKRHTADAKRHRDRVSSAHNIAHRHHTSPESHRRKGRHHSGDGDGRHGDGRHGDGRRGSHSTRRSDSSGSDERRRQIGSRSQRSQRSNTYRQRGSRYESPVSSDDEDNQRSGTRRSSRGSRRRRTSRSPFESDSSDSVFDLKNGRRSTTRTLDERARRRHGERVSSSSSYESDREPRGGRLRFDRNIDSDDSDEYISRRRHREGDRYILGGRGDSRGGDESSRNRQSGRHGDDSYESDSALSISTSESGEERTARRPRVRNRRRRTESNSGSENNNFEVMPDFLEMDERRLGNTKTEGRPLKKDTSAKTLLDKKDQNPQTVKRATSPRQLMPPSPLTQLPTAKTTTTSEFRSKLGKKPTEADVRDVQVEKAQRRRLPASMKHTGFKKKGDADAPAPTAPRRKTVLPNPTNEVPKSPPTKNLKKAPKKALKKKGAIISLSKKDEATVKKPVFSDVQVEAAKRRRLPASMKHEGYKLEAGPPPKTKVKAGNSPPKFGDPDDIDIPERPIIGSAAARR